MALDEADAKHQTTPQIFVRGFTKVGGSWFAGHRRSQLTSALSQSRPEVSRSARSFPWSVASAVNNDDVLRSCLLSSPDLATASEVILQRGYASAASAYNAAIDKAKTDIIVLVHQDVFLPRGWINRAQKSLELLSEKDPKWAVSGVWGGKREGNFVGHLYCAGLMRVLGGPSEQANEVSSLDEVLLILRKSSGVRFDEGLRGFHMYGTDICQEANSRGLKSYAISAFCVHNTNGYRMLPLDFWKSYFFLRRKWRSQLPITTSCTKVTTGCWPMIWWNIDRMANLLLQRHHPGKRVPNPQVLYDDLVRSGRVAA